MLKVGEKYAIGSDTENIIVFVKPTNTPRNKNLKASGEYRAEYFCSSLKSAFILIADKSVRDTDMKDLKTISEKQQDIYALIERICPNIKVSDLKD